MNKKNSLDGTPKEKKPRILRIINTTIVISTIFLFSPYLIGMILSIPNRAPYIVIKSPSMDPVIKTGDLLLVKKVSPENIKIGDIIAFDTRGCWQEPTNPPVIVHRVVFRWESDDIWYFTTKGDANEIDDRENVNEFCIIGVVISVIPKIGWASIILEDYKPLIFLLIFACFFANIVWHLIKKPFKLICDGVYIIIFILITIFV